MFCLWSNVKVTMAFEKEKAIGLRVLVMESAKNGKNLNNKAMLLTKQNNDNDKLLLISYYY